MSKQQDHYLRLRAEGLSLEAACFEADFPPAEAELLEAEIDRLEAELDAHFAEHPAAARQAASHQESDVMDKQSGDAVATYFEDTDVTTSVVDLAAETLRGDLRDAVLEWFKGTPKAWHVMSEAEQKAFAGRADSFAAQLVREACSIIAAAERPTIVARLVEYKEKEGVEAKLKLPSTGETVAALHAACGQDVLLVTAGAENFGGQRGDAQIDADAPELPIDADAPPADDSDLNHGEHEEAIVDRVSAAAE